MNGGCGRHGRPDQGHDDAGLHGRRHPGIDESAGAGRLLGRLVRPLQAADARSSRRRSRPPRARSSWSRWISTSTRRSPASSACSRSRPSSPFPRASRSTASWARCPKARSRRSSSGWSARPGRTLDALLAEAERRWPPARRGRPRGCSPRSTSRTPRTSRRSRGLARAAIASRRPRAGQGDAVADARRARKPIRPSPARAPPSTSPSRPRSVGDLAQPGRRRRRRSQESPGRASTLPWRSLRQGAARRRPTSCSTSCGATATGTMTARASSWCSSSRPGDRPTRRRSPGAAAVLDPVLLSTSSDQTPGSARHEPSHYKTPADLPPSMPVFPAAGRPAAAARPPAAEHLRAALSRHDRRRAAGIAAHRHDPAGGRGRQRPAAPASRSAAPAGSPSSPRPATAAISSSSPALPAFASSRKRSVDTPYRQCRIDAASLRHRLHAAGRRGRGRSRSALIVTLKAYLEANSLQADWEAIRDAPNEALVNALSMMSPFDVREKQALLEAHR